MSRARLCGPLLLMLAIAAPDLAHAQLVCWVGMGSINFGNVNQIGAPDTNVNGTMSVSCAGARQPYVHLCIALGTPVGSSWDPRYFERESGARLEYNIYKDPGHTQIWGSEFSTAGAPREVDLPVRLGVGYTTVPYYARVPAQDTAREGMYNTTFSGSKDATVRAVEYSVTPPSCSASMPIVSQFEFGVSANVVADCAVSASRLDFGVADTSALRPTRATSTISLRCTLGVSYSIALDAGTGNGATVAQRHMTRDGGAETLDYGLYTDAARRRVWGDGSSGTQTKSGTGNGTQSTETLTVYGELAGQDAPAPGAYQDTITITVTF